MGVGLELGSGLLLARLPPAPPTALPASASSKSVEAWSPKSSSSLGRLSPREAFLEGAGDGQGSPAWVLGGPAALPPSPSSLARSSRWSAPCFVTVAALSAGAKHPTTGPALLLPVRARVWGGADAGLACPPLTASCVPAPSPAGLVLGASRAFMVMGLLSDAAVQRLGRGQAVAAGQEFSICLLDGER